MLTRKVHGILDAVATTASEQLESETLEFKEYRDVGALHNSKDLAEEICALANKSGGLLIVGVRDSSNVPSGMWESQLIGFPPIDVTEATARIKGKLRDCDTLSAVEVTHRGKNYLALSVERRPDVIVSTTSGKFYIRDGRSSRPMSSDEVTLAVKSLTTYDWSAEPIDASINDCIDPDSAAEAIAEFAQFRGLPTSPDVASYLEAIGATHNGRLLNGGLLWLGTTDAIAKNLGIYEFRFTWKKPNGEILVNDVWQHNLWNSIHRARSHFDKCNSSQEFSHQDKSFTVPKMDPKAFHEAFLNAIVHRDYCL